MKGIATPLWKISNKIKENNLSENGDLLHIIRSSEFRMINDLKGQIIYLHEKFENIKQSLIAVILDTSESTVSRVLQGKTPAENINHRPAALLTNEEEEILIEWIFKLQSHGDCPQSSRVRFKAQEIYGKRTGETKEFSRTWWQSFKNRHSDKIGVKVLSAMEEKRVEVKPEDVRKYISCLITSLNGIKSCKQIINIDETGFCSRPMKGKTKKCVYIKYHPKKPSFREGVDANHVSLLAGINLQGESLKPFLITKTNIKYEKSILQLADDFCWTKTSKGYLTNNAMKEWIKNILSEYVKSVRNELKDPNAKIVIIMDNFGCHTNTDVKALLDEIGNIDIVCIPAHSSHFLQPLDLFPFSQLKKSYTRTTTQKTSPRVNGKVIHILRAWHEACFKPNILVGWTRAGIISCKEAPYVRIDMRTITLIIESQCNGQDYFSD